MQLRKGWIYIIEKTPKTFYIVKQVGQRSWVALNVFTSKQGVDDIMQGNSISLGAKIGETIKVVSYSVQNVVGFRETMFNVLKYGEL